MNNKKENMKKVTVNIEEIVSTIVDIMKEWGKSVLSSSIGVDVYSDGKYEIVVKNGYYSTYRVIDGKQEIATHLSAWEEGGDITNNVSPSDFPECVDEDGDTNWNAIFMIYAEEGDLADWTRNTLVDQIEDHNSDEDKDFLIEIE